MPSSFHNNAATTELLRKVRKVEIRTKALSKQIFAGEYHSAFKGRGMAFSEVREYNWGDDVRTMDWNVTARLREPFIKVFEEERELTVVLLVDVSRSSLFGTNTLTKREMLTEIAAVLAYSAISNNDKVGALFFSGKVEKFIPPQKGRSHLLHIIREMIELQPSDGGTDISQALRFLSNAIKKRCTAFLLSDMIDVNTDASPRYEDALKVASLRHDVSVIRVHDPREKSLVPMGLVHVRDLESGRDAWINTDSRRVRQSYADWFSNLQELSMGLLNKYRIDSIDIDTDQDYVKALMALFSKR